MRVEFLIQPNAKNSEFVALYDGKIKVKIGAKPVDGSANEELLCFLSKKLDIAKSKIKIIKGEKGKNKLLDINKELSFDELISLLKD